MVEHNFETKCNDISTAEINTITHLNAQNTQRQVILTKEKIRLTVKKGYNTYRKQNIKKHERNYFKLQLDKVKTKSSTMHNFAKINSQK